MASLRSSSPTAKSSNEFSTISAFNSVSNLHLEIHGSAVGQARLPSTGHTTHAGLIPSRQHFHPACS
jgi:hypothetical protein